MHGILQDLLAKGSVMLDEDLLWEHVWFSCVRYGEGTYEGSKAVEESNIPEIQFDMHPGHEWTNSPLKFAECL